MEAKTPEKKGLPYQTKENVDDHEEQMQILGRNWCALVLLSGVDLSSL